MIYQERKRLLNWFPILAISRGFLHFDELTTWLRSLIVFLFPVY